MQKSPWKHSVVDPSQFYQNTEKKVLFLFLEKFSLLSILLISFLFFWFSENPNFYGEGNNPQTWLLEKQEMKRNKNQEEGIRGRNALLELIKSCGKERDMPKARRLHSEAIQKNFIPNDVYVTTALLSTYLKCGSIKEAENVFKELLVRDTVSWNAPMSGYANHGQDHEALESFKKMQEGGVPPDAISFLCLMKVCGSIGSTCSSKETAGGRKGCCARWSCGGYVWKVPYAWKNTKSIRRAT